MNIQVERTKQNELRVVALTASAFSVAAFLWFYVHSEILLYGDAVAHINIARRVFDSRTPGPLQLGTVWLPLPHVATIPFILNDWMWRSGVGGSIPSMIAYVLGVAGIFRLVRARFSNITATAAAAIYALNPNLLYMQSTGMTESIFLSTVIWAVVYLDAVVRALRTEDATAEGLPAYKALERCGMVLAAAMLTRYDGWVLAGIVGVVLLVVLARAWRQLQEPSRRRFVRSAKSFFLLCALVPMLWLAHNYAISGNPLDFANGPYSAKAIEQRTMQPGQEGHPGTEDPWVSALFFLKAAKLNVAWGAWERWMFAALLLGTALVIRHWTAHWPLLLLWFPLGFYAYSVAYGSVPIFLPVWWPHSYYNVRYGLELLPAFAVFVGVLIGAFYEWFDPKWKWVAVAAGVVLVAGSYVSVALATPICLREARVNSISRLALEERLAAELRSLPGDASILMFTGSYVGALQREGIHLRRIISEANHPAWDEALVDPAGYADYVVAVEGDPVWYAARLFPKRLEKVSEFDSTGKPRVTVYRSTRGRTPDTR